MAAALPACLGMQRLSARAARGAGKGLHAHCYPRRLQGACPAADTDYGLERTATPHGSPGLPLRLAAGKLPAVPRPLAVVFFLLLQGPADGCLAAASRRPPRPATRPASARCAWLLPGASRAPVHSSWRGGGAPGSPCLCPLGWGCRSAAGCPAMRRTHGRRAGSAKVWGRASQVVWLHSSGS